MDYQLGTLFPAFKDALLGLVRTAPENRNPEKIEASVRATAGVIAVLDAHLEDNDYVAGSSFTMGDVALGSLVYRWLELDIERPDLPALRAWYERLAEPSRIPENRHGLLRDGGPARIRGLTLLEDDGTASLAVRQDNGWNSGSFAIPACVSG